MTTMRLPARLPLSGDEYLDLRTPDGRHRAPVEVESGIDPRMTQDLGSVLQWLAADGGGEPVEPTLAPKRTAAPAPRQRSGRVVNLRVVDPGRTLV